MCTRYALITVKAKSYPLLDPSIVEMASKWKKYEQDYLEFDGRLTQFALCLLEAPSFLLMNRFYLCICPNLSEIQNPGEHF